MDDDIDSINIVPLVDVMLVLLTIVLTTASFVAAGRIPVDLAKSSQAIAAVQVPLVVTLTRDKQLFVNDRPVKDLAQAMAAYSLEQAVAVRADGGLALSDFVDLVDRVKALGFSKVSLEVRRS